MKFRDLTAEEIDCRVATISEKGCSLLLYKDARADMIILDETVGSENWQRHHSRDNANCIVSIWDDKKGQWIEKEDTGTESYTEKEKGQASDSFKRACFNWGIGRELYTAPFIWVGADKFTLTKGSNGKLATYDKFAVSEIVIEEKKIVKLSIINTKTNNIVFKWNKGSSGTQPRAKANSSEITQKSKDALNSAIKGYVTKSGKDMNVVLKELCLAVGKNSKEFDENDAKKALEIISTWDVA